jgi:hypothetical protein
MSSGHSHSPASKTHERALWLALLLTGTFLGAEVAAGLAFNSLALLSDAVGCCRFHGHLVKVEDETGGGSWEREGNSAGSSSLKP